MGSGWTSTRGLDQIQRWTWRCAPLAPGLCTAGQSRVNGMTSANHAVQIGESIGSTGRGACWHPGNASLEGGGRIIGHSAKEYGTNASTVSLFGVLVAPGLRTALETRLPVRRVSRERYFRATEDTEYTEWDGSVYKADGLVGRASAR